MKPNKEQVAELFNLYHLARVAMSGDNPSKYDRKCWSVKEFCKIYPEISAKWAYMVFEST